jgi:hypothetical protein
MTAAIAELCHLRPDAKRVLEIKRFEQATPSDLAGLQAISRFLERRGLEYTRSSLSEESGIDNTRNGIDLEKPFARGAA